MKKEIIINATLNEVRIAITEEGRLAEFFIELPDKERLIGNIYFGKVTKVVQGINAAFVDIGMKQDAFLHFSDVDETLENIYSDDIDEEINIFDDEDDKSVDEFPEFVTNPEPIEDKESKEIETNKGKKGKKNKKTPEKPTKQHEKVNMPVFSTKKSGLLKINLESKKELIVQIVREAFGNKGVKVSTKIGIPGRFVVLLPYENAIGISKKIQSYQERKRLRNLARNTLPEGFGCIIRTAAQNKTEDELKHDWESLLNIWNDIDKKIAKSKPPSLLYEDMSLATSVIRDLFTPDVKKVVIDSKKLHKEITTYLKWVAPTLVNRVDLYTGKDDIFKAYHVDEDLEKTLVSKVLLPCGGSIVIEQTEAMFVVDVNSGRSVSETEQENTAVNTNLEAVKEIARQVRLRDIAGMIVIDCIDMQHDKNRKKVFNEMRNELNRDRAKTVVYPLTQLNLMQITRQRINQNISEKISELCPTCNGSGRITSKAVLVNGIERWLKNFRTHSTEFRVILQINPHLVSYLTEGTLSRLSRLMLKYFVKIKIQQNEHIAIGDFKFYSVRSQKDITQSFL